MTQDDLSTRALQRRRLLQAAGGLSVAFTVPLTTSYAQAPVRLPGSMNTYRRLEGWLRIGTDGRVSAFSGKVELGQGIITALSQIVADELDVDLERVQLVSGDTAQSPNEGVTAGSLSIEQSGAALRQAAAEARALLMNIAAQRLGAASPEQAQLQTRNGWIIAPGGTQFSYPELAGGDALKGEIKSPVSPKPAAARRLIGQPVPRQDLPGKLTGAPLYIQDMRLPGMVYGRVVRPPSPRAILQSIDTAAARALPGVVAVVRDGSFVAVAAEREEQAIAAAQALRASARWNEDARLPPAGEALFPFLKTMRSEDTVVGEKSDPASFARATRTFMVEYTKPFVSHGSIGPSCALAQWAAGKLTVWSHAQGPFQQREDLAKALQVPLSAIRVIHSHGSGCYGHNGADDVGLDAALLARATGERPVKLQWMREDEFQWEPYGSAMAIRMRAALDAEGRIVNWVHELWSHTHSMRPGDPDGDNLLASWYLEHAQRASPARNIPQPAGGGDRNAIPLYDFPNQKVITHLIPEMPVRVSALRTLGAYGNVFALESFMDELALAAHVDPALFRLRHLQDARARAVIERVVKMSAWAEPGRTLGIAFAKYKNLAVYTAIVAEVTVDRTSGVVRVPRAWCAADAGMVINPDGFANQIEGGMVQSASWTLHESVAYDRERIAVRSWADYPVLRFSEVPVIKVELIDRPEQASHGVGEGSQGPMAAAIANGFAKATGVRLRDLPLTPVRVKAALA